MNKLFTFLLLILTYTSFSQAYVKGYLADKMSRNEAESYPVIIKLKAQVDLTTLKQDLLKSNVGLMERRTAIVKKLYKENASQNAFDSFLSDLQNDYSSEIKQINKFWAVNAVACHLSETMIEILLGRSDVDYIQYDLPVYGEKVTVTEAVGNRSVGQAEPGLVAINARPMWGLGYTGRNRIAMNIDTGVSVEHPTLGDRFLGHYLPLSQCWLGFENPYPYDIDRSSFHGTHTMGTMIGLDIATADTIGLAFNAFWISTDPIVTNAANIRPMSDYYIGFEWALNPDGDINTSNDIPDVINNSWGVENTAWTDCDPLGYSFIEALEAADCSIIFSAGNEGSGEATTGMPASIAKDTLNIFSVGALDAADVDYDIANFSSRGPSYCATEGSLAIKPEVSAPGVDVRSASGSDSYKLLSGTSMAGPHVAGAVLLLREAFPEITSMELKNALYQTAIDLGDVGEDNDYGRGLIDVYAAYEFLSETYTPTPPVGQDYDLVVEEVIGLDSYTCNLNNEFEVVFKNNGETSLSNFTFRMILNSDTLIEQALEISLDPNETYSMPISVDLTEFDNNITLEINKDGIQEFNIYNNYHSVIINRLFQNEIPYYEDFETNSLSLSSLNFFRLNPDLENTWELDSTIGIEGSSVSLKMPFAYYSEADTELDYLKSGAFEIPATGNTFMYFKHAYAQYTHTKKDSLFILVSNFCDEFAGDTIYTNGGADMTTRSNLFGNFTPSDSTEWADNAINLTDYAGQTIFFTFLAKNDASNNLYIDELRIENGLTLNEKSKITEQLRMYPNPTTGKIYFDNIAVSENITVFDISGKMMLKSKVEAQSIDVSFLKNGIYFLKTSSNLIGKLVIQK